MPPPKLHLRRDFHHRSKLIQTHNIQSAIGTERQLPKNITVAVTCSNSHSIRIQRSRNINAPLPGAYDPQVPTIGHRLVYGVIGN